MARIVALVKPPTERELKLREMYDTNGGIQALADKIHERRMLPPPTCLDCIESAVKKLRPEVIGE